MRVDNETLHKWQLLELKAAEAYIEEANSAERLYNKLMDDREKAYDEALSMGVPENVARAVANNTTRRANLIISQGEDSLALAKVHRDKAKALHIQREKQFRRDLRVRFSG